MKALEGIHHVTAITADAQANADFYSGVLGLRLVKKTVNFDDPGSYHLYYGDRTGSPGTLITFFEWPGATSGKPGTGEPVAVAFAVPSGSLRWWEDRFSGLGLFAEDHADNRLLLPDPDGMRIELLESSEEEPNSGFWSDGGIPREYAIQRIQSIVLELGSPERSESLYAGELGFRAVASGNYRKRYQLGQNWVEVVTPDAARRGRMGAGTIHHVAFRTEDDASQDDWLKRVNAIGLNSSPVMDRKYFRSIYFRERNGVLFEIATDGPGMTIDESADHLGEALSLPSEYESMHEALNRRLKPVVPGRTPTHV